ncbi:uncharacterized protein LOC123533538 [Mercenaria mercenaria]|uniref:uncharacterized protein LOC123533538 n=1 Tax=Mercenaria mercenaria TaxID=6596 RepID=UPI00234F5CB6|nr:uncharacterized protein LOC123533538 [Mercenaria mercenaria]XP_045171130.2 uncharacterized protein LOC123533538 [Mercenaria mercenaria]
MASYWAEDDEDSGYVRVAGSQLQVNKSNDGTGVYSTEMSNLHDSGYVRVAGSQLQVNKSNDGAGVYSTEMSNLNAVKRLNKNLSHQIQTLKDEIKGFKAEKNALTETHKKILTDRNEKLTRFWLRKMKFRKEKSFT